MVRFNNKQTEQNNRKQKIIVTSALPFVNNVPHLGNLVCVISADVFTRYLKLKGADVISVLGTDEHGTTSETKAIEEGLTTRQLCDKYYKIHTDIYHWFECAPDCYGRTSSQANKEITIDIFNKLHKNGFIVEDTIAQLYCEHCKRFLADRFVNGTCPTCNYEHARGDQCENCSALLNATELVNPTCKLCATTPIIKNSKHLFMDLPKLEPTLKEWIANVEDKWSDNALTMTQAWLREGLRLRCITRDLQWGIQVPLEGFEGKVFYSWFDAPIGYIGITREHRKDWEDYWKNPKETRLIQFMGKDNIPFHTILFPAFLMGTQDNYTLLTDISVNEFLNYEGGQFSKSRNVGVFGDDAKSTGIHSDVFRYYLMINRPERTDTEFSWDDFEKKNNAELVANIGNLINRTIVFLNRNYEGVVPEIHLAPEDKKFLEEAKEIEKNIEEAFERINLKEALKEAMHLSKLGNQYLQENEPWKNPDEKRKATCLAVLINFAKDLSIVFEPFIPGAAKSIRKQLGIEETIEQKWDDLGKLSIKSGHKINEATLLFRKIEDKEIIAWREQFAGRNKDKENKQSTTKNNITQNAKKTAPIDAKSHATATTKPSIQLRVAKIIGVTKHPDAEKLYIEEIDFGDEQRHIVSGLVPYYTEDELVGKKIIVVTNLEPATIRGVQSNGMLLAAEENGVVGLLTTDAEIGTYVHGEKHATPISIKDFAKIKIVAKEGVVLLDGRELHVGEYYIFVEKNIMNGAVR